MCVLAPLTVGQLVCCMFCTVCSFRIMKNRNRQAITKNPAPFGKITGAGRRRRHGTSSGQRLLKKKEKKKNSGSNNLTSEKNTPREINGKENLHVSSEMLNLIWTFGAEEIYLLLRATAFVTCFYRLRSLTVNHYGNRPSLG